MIFYFTATGNSFSAAMAIAKETKENLISISEAAAQKHFHYKAAEGEGIGFVVPTYYYGVPTIVMEFLSQLVLEVDENRYLYLVLTCGSTIGNADKIFEQQLNKSGHQLSAVYSVPMVDNYVLLFPVAAAEKQKVLLDQAELKIERIVSCIRNKERVIQNENRGFAPYIVTPAAYLLYKNGRKTKKFFVKENCIHCGLCQKICPSNAIQIMDGKPVWQKKQCVHCLGCINRCPVQAIEYGKLTLKHGRYVNPRVNL